MPDPESTTWGEAANLDRAIAASPASASSSGIRLQEELAADAIAHHGALDIAGQRIRDLDARARGVRVAVGAAGPSRSDRPAVAAGPRAAPRRHRPGRRSTSSRRRTTGRCRTGLFSSARAPDAAAGPARTALLRRGAPKPAEVLHSSTAARRGVSRPRTASCWATPARGSTCGSRRCSRAGTSTTPASPPPCASDRPRAGCRRARRRELQRMRGGCSRRPGEAAPWAPALCSCSSRARARAARPPATTRRC